MSTIENSVFVVSEIAWLRKLPDSSSGLAFPLRIIPVQHVIRAQSRKASDDFRITVSSASGRDGIGAHTLL
jgi:hypothetical protein